jgi:type VI secretion system protein ImpA
MSDLDDAENKVASWLRPLDDASAPCGPDLEYDNDFLVLTQAAAGKPESQFGPAEPPDWPAVRTGVESMLGRSRDLRLALLWLRAGLRLKGYSSLSSGLHLLAGLIEQHWDHVHPLPDPDDGDPYARVNALAALPDPAAGLADLRAAYVVRDRAVGMMDLRAIELSVGLAQPFGNEASVGKDQAIRMVAAAVERQPEMRAAAQDALAAVGALQAALVARLGAELAPDLRPVLQLAKAVVAMLPASASGAAASGESSEGGEQVLAAEGGPAIHGAVRSREDAVRAIDMVCAYLERAEPSNPAPLFLRRAQQLVNHNFLQLMKELAPGAMPDLARIVGVDPETVETPEKP